MHEPKSHFAMAVFSGPGLFWTIQTNYTTNLEGRKTEVYLDESKVSHLMSVLSVLKGVIMFKVKYFSLIDFYRL